MGLEPGAAGWKAQTNPLSCGKNTFLFDRQLTACARCL